MKQLKELNLFDKKYIIFDMDGTLIDSIGIWNITDYRVIKQFTKKDIDLSVIQKKRDTFLEKNTESDIYLEYCNYLIRQYHLEITKEELIQLRWEISSKFLEEDVEFKPYAVELIKKLKSLGFILILATSTTQIQLDIYTKKNKKMMNQMNINQYFDLIIRKEDVQYKKPHPEIYLKVLEYFHANPEECLVFEDSLHGVMAAKSAGIEVVNVYDAYSDCDRNKINDLTDYKIPSYQEFIEKALQPNKKLTKEKSNKQ